MAFSSTISKTKRHIHICFFLLLHILTTLLSAAHATSYNTAITTADNSVNWVDDNIVHLENVLVRTSVSKLNYRNASLSNKRHNEDLDFNFPIKEYSSSFKEVIYKPDCYGLLFLHYLF